MMMITKDIGRKLVAADKAFVAGYDADNPDGPKTPQEIVVKFFAPWGAATWYVVQGTPLNDDGEVDYDNWENAADWHMFGWADLGLGPGMAELGYVTLNELMKVKGPFGLKIERDMYYDGHTLAEVMEKAA